MQKLLVILAFIGLNFSGSSLSGEKIVGVTDSNVLMSLFIEQEELVEENYYFEEEEILPTEEVIVNEVETNLVVETVVEAVEVTIEDIEVEELIVEEIVTETEELTYDQQHQKDVGDEEEPVPAEVMVTWYVAEAAKNGMTLILESYSMPEYSFVIESTPSNYVYQYDFYLDSPEGDHANLVAVFQYDATGGRTFKMDPVSGKWE